MIHRYRNGTYDVTIDDTDGTKIRDSGENDSFVAEFPESIDLNITDACSVGCPFCYRNCTSAGANASLQDVSDIVSTMHPFTEVALGGGSPIEHPRIDEILEECRSRNVFSNITVHRTHFMENLGRIDGWAESRLVFGVGCSADGYYDDVASECASRGNVVVHLIAGIVRPCDIAKYAVRGCKLLILGYKNMGRASVESVPDMSETARVVGDIVSGRIRCKVVSFDNLALEQLGIRRLIGEDRWNGMYMGDDGVDGALTSASMYVDAVSHVYARNSLTKSVHAYDPHNVPTVTEMYRNLVRSE